MVLTVLYGEENLYARYLAGVIGTGLFLGTANALANGGPLGLLLGYLIMGSICFSVMVSNPIFMCRKLQEKIANPKKLRLDFSW